MIFQAQTIEQNDLQRLISFFESMTIKHTFTVVHEKQRPSFALMLIEGEIHILLKKKTYQIITTNQILGLHHLLNNSPVTYGCRICEGSKILMIPKSILNEGSWSHFLPGFDHQNKWNHS